MEQLLEISCYRNKCTMYVFEEKKIKCCKQFKT